MEFLKEVGNRLNGVSFTFSKENIVEFRLRWDISWERYDINRVWTCDIKFVKDNVTSEVNFEGKDFATIYSKIQTFLSSFN